MSIITDEESDYKLKLEDTKIPASQVIKLLEKPVSMEYMSQLNYLTNTYSPSPIVRVFP